MAALQVHDHVHFRTMTPDGPISGTGHIIKIFPAGKSCWLHVRQEDGHVRMLYQATATVEVVALEAA